MSDGESRLHHYTTKSITIPYVPNGKTRDQVGAGGESRMPEGREISPQWVSKYATMSPTRNGKSPPLQMHPGARRGDICE